MKKNLKTFIGIAMVLLGAFILFSSIEIEFTQVFIPNVDEVMLDNDYRRIDEQDIFTKDYVRDIDKQYDSESITFNLDWDFMYISLEEIEKEEYSEFAVFAYSYIDNRYAVSYYRKNNGEYKRRTYLYAPDVSDVIELDVSEFEGDFLAESDSEKKEYFKKTKEIFEEVLDDLDLTTDDLILWSEENRE